MIYKTYRIGDICSTVKGTYPTMKTEPGQYSLVVTAEYRRSAGTYQLEGPAVCVPLISSTGHGDAALHRVHYQEGKFALANLLVALIPNDINICDAKYLYHLFMAKKDEYFVPLMSGTANVSLKIQDIANVEIPLPPVEEQRRIVARIEDLAARIEEARGLRREAVEEAEILKKVASNCFSTPSRFYTRIERLENITKRITKGESPEWQGYSYQESGPIFVRSENVLWGRLDITRKISIPMEFHKKLNRSQLRSGDVLINLVGASIGRACVVPGGITDANINQAVAVISPNSEWLNSRYLMYFLLSVPVQAVLNSGKVETARPNISLGDLCNLETPVPSLSDQIYIVNYLDDLQSKFDSLKQLQAETSAELDALLPSILDKAFKGEL